jgi:lipoate-protein ligase A
MKYLDLTLPTPAQNVACDEALLQGSERDGGEEILRVWESPDYCVVVGYSNDENKEVNLAACPALKIPVLRRCSGGGAVVLGRGCLNYALILEIARRPEIKTLADANRFVMQRNRDAVQTLVKDRVEIHGATDLAIGKLKFSGNSQRRGRRCVLFHGSLLLNFDLSMIEKLLPMPSKQPRYRNSRPHSEFLMNLGIEAERLKLALQQTWGARVAT